MAKEAAVQVNASEFKMSPVGSGRSKSRRGCCGNTGCIAGTRGNTFHSKVKQLGSIVARFGERENLLFVLSQPDFNLETMKLKVMKVFTFYFGLLLSPQKKK